MRFWEKNIWWISILLIIVIGFGGLITWTCIEAKQYHEWYESLTPTEKEAYALQKQQEYESRIQRYEVVSVHKYTKNTTNNFGGIIRTEVCYSFTYVSGDKLCSVDDFKHLEYGLTKVTIGDSDLYIINNNGETTSTLQLTKETLANIKGLN